MLVLIGESNPYGTDPRYALFDEPDGSAGHRLRTLILRFERRRYLDPGQVARYNLCDGGWSVRLARIRAERIAQSRPHDTLVLLGRKVASGFALDDFGSFELHDKGTLKRRDPFWLNQSGRVVLLPHPSGRCREWNEPGAFKRARDVLREAGVDFGFDD